MAEPSGDVSGGGVPEGDSPDVLSSAVMAALGAPDRSERARAIVDAAEVVDPDQLLEAVADHADARRRNAAMEALVRGGARSVPALVRSLRHADPEVVMFCAGVLARTGSAAAVPHLVSLLDHEDVNVVQQVIDSLSQLRSSLAVNALTRVLDRDPWLRFAAVHALGQIGDRRAVGALAPLLDDPGVRDVVISALGRIGSPDALAHLFRVLREASDGESFGASLRAIGEALEFQPNEEALRNLSDWTGLMAEQPAALEERLQRVLLPEPAPQAPGDGQEVRRAAAAIVRALRLRPLYTALVLAGRDPTLREVLEFSAVSIGEDIAPVLEQGLGAPNASVRALACECLGAMGQRTSAMAIERLLVDPEAAVRSAAINALVRLGHDPSVGAIGQRFDDPGEGVRHSAVAAYCRMDVEAVTASLIVMCEQGRAAVATALSVMTANPHPGQCAFIASCLGNTSAEVRGAAVRALARQASADVVGMLEPLLRDDDPAVRAAVIEVIGQVRSARVRQLLLEQFPRDRETRPALVRALAGLGDTTVIPLLTEVFASEPRPGQATIIQALGILSDPAADAFLGRQLACEDPELRRAAVMALGQKSSPAVLRQLVLAVRDQDEGVRAALADALARSADPLARDALERLAVDESRTVSLIARHVLERAQAELPPGRS